MFYKAVITSKGLALDAKIKAGQTTAAFTRVKLGDGTYDGQEELKEATDLKNTRNEFGISSIKVIDENTVRIRIVTNNSNLNSGYYISELALFATDPDEGEILYSISLGVPEKMDYQPSEAEMFNATATIDILTSISDAETANIQTGTGAAASAEDLAELETRMEGIETPEFDASGTVEGITGKTTLLASFVTRMPLVKFMRNVVAGFKLVLYAGQVVNNCVTDNAGLPLSAAQGKVLMDLYTVLNTKITWKLLGTIKGRQAIDLPQQGTFSELIAVVSYTYSVTRNYFIPIPAISLPATEQRANMGTGRGGDLGENVSVSLVISATSIRLANFVFDGAAYEANTTLTVYYK